MRGSSAASCRWPLGWTGQAVRPLLPAALKAKVPAEALYVVAGTGHDERLSEAVGMANSKGIPVHEVPRQQLDAMTGNGMHQGIGLKIQPYKYADLDDLLESVDGPGMFLELARPTASLRRSSWPVPAATYIASAGTLA